MKIDNLIISVLIQNEKEYKDLTTKSGNSAGSIGSVVFSNFHDLIDDPADENYNVIDVNKELKNLAGEAAVKALQHYIKK